jgi:AbrB family looped-hinge helix DNA binding protein
MSIVTTSSKGQVVIPKEVRDRVGINTGTKVMVKAVDGHVEIHPLPENPVEFYFGIFKNGSSMTKALLKERKRDALHEDKKSL